MVIYNIGLPRTGTRHIFSKIKELGFNCVHPHKTKNYNFEFEHLKNNVEKWNKNNFFYSDTPVWHPVFWSLINIKEHKIIYSYRNCDSWIKSVKNNIDLFLPEGNYRKKDKYWFTTYFYGFDDSSLKKTFYRHKNDVKTYFSDFLNKEILYINILDDDEENENKLKSFLL